MSGGQVLIVPFSNPGLPQSHHRFRDDTESPTWFVALPWYTFGSSDLYQHFTTRVFESEIDEWGAGYHIRGIPVPRCTRGGLRGTTSQIEGPHLCGVSPVLPRPPIIAVTKDIPPLSSILVGRNRSIRRDSCCVQKDWHNTI